MLTDQQIDAYRRQGYVCCPGFVPAGTVAAFRQEIDRISASNTVAHFDATRVEMEPDQEPDGNKIRRIYEPCEYYDGFRDYSRSPGILDAVEQLVGPNILLHYSKLNMKPARIGSIVEWHQDLSFYPLTNPDSLAVLIYLDDADARNGCLKVIPGRHTGALMDHTRDGFFQGCITEPIDENAAEDMVGPAGTAIFMHAMTPHASAQNLGDRPRRTLIISYRAADALPVYVGERTPDTEVFTHLVRGETARTVRFGFSDFPLPVYGTKEASLYALQEQSRQNRSTPAA